jgi:FdhD protein
MDREVTITNAAGESSRDYVTLEEPLQIIVDGHPIAVSMRTPGHDEELALGFLLTEGVIRHAAEVRRIDATLRENHVLVFLRDDVAVDLSRLTRHVFSASSCGICGKATIDAVSLSLPPVADGFRVHHEVLLDAPLRLIEQQSTFSRTGGLHAAGLFDAEGKLLVAREDVGRHNALDKVLGHALTAGIDLTACFLLVSGRVSFEIMQKALAGGIPLVAAISAPSSLAVDFAASSNQTLVAFLRPPRFQIYAGAERLVIP